MLSVDALNREIDHRIGAMSVEEFVALKQKLVDRANQALDSLGEDIAEQRVRTFSYNRVHVIKVFGDFTIKLRWDNNDEYVYKSRQQWGEQQLGWDHKMLVRLYFLALMDLDRALVLDDLSRV